LNLNISAPRHPGKELLYIQFTIIIFFLVSKLREKILDVQQTSIMGYEPQIKMLNSSRSLTEIRIMLQRGVFKKIYFIK